MNWIYKILICIVISTISSALYYACANNLDAFYHIDPTTAIWFSLTAILCLVLTQLNVSAALPKASGISKKPAIKGGRQTGSVKWFNGGKGFGFISCENGEEIFVHFRSVRKNSPRLTPGKQVEFAIVQGKKGAEADDVAVID